MATIKFDFSDLPSDTALFLAQESHHADELADEMSRCMRLGEVDRSILRDEIIGVTAKTIEGYLP